MARETKLQPGFSRRCGPGEEGCWKAYNSSHFHSGFSTARPSAGRPQAARAREGARWRERRRRHFLSPLGALKGAGAVRGHLKQRPPRWKWRQRSAPSPSVRLSACGRLHTHTQRGEAGGGERCVTSASPHHLCGEVSSALQTEGGQRILQVQPLTPIFVTSIPTLFAMAIAFSKRGQKHLSKRLAGAFGTSRQCQGSIPAS